jgi:hypothetical protein
MCAAHGGDGDRLVGGGACVRADPSLCPGEMSDHGIAVRDVAVSRTVA